MDDLLTVEEVAKILKLTPYSVRRLLKEKKLPGFKVGGSGQWRISRAELKRYMTGDNTPQTAP